MTDLSIVVVHWNVPALLDDCLRSIAQECAATPDISTEMLVVDCASPSETHRTVVARHDGVRLIALAENRGYAAGCNAGIAASSVVGSENAARLSRRPADSDQSRCIAR